MELKRWTKDQTKLAFYLYCQMPFGRIHSRNAEVVQLAKFIGRTPSAVAMKMLNLASLDPSVTGSGRSGLGNASSLDRDVWDEFHHDWEKLALECEKLKAQGGLKDSFQDIEDGDFLGSNNFFGETKKVVTEVRIKQSFFRRAVMSSYGGRCWISGISDHRLLIASHIVPWGVDKFNRLNPSNGLCLSAIHDKAFDKGLLSLTDDYKVLLSDEIKKQDSDFYKHAFLAIENKSIRIPEKFIPSISFISYHRENIFLG